MNKNKPDAAGKTWTNIGWGLAILFVGSILWSMWEETLLPLIRSGNTRSLWLHLVGMPIILLGTGIFVYGGIVFVRATFAALADSGLIENMRVIKGELAGDKRKAQWANAGLLVQSWLPGLGWLGFGFALIALGGFLINL